MGNAILFPVPTPTYNCFSGMLKHHLVWIDEEPQPCSTTEISSAKSPSETERPRFPGLLFTANSPHTLLYFHGNSTDLGEVFEEMEMLQHHCECNILAIEFPGYGVCNHVAATPATIDAWGRSAFLWLVKRGVNPKSIIPFGRSIGTGPAAKLAASLKMESVQLGGLILHSPYESIHKVVSDYTSFGTWIIPDHWNVQEALECLSPTTPLLIIHGEDDEVIPVRHGKSLFQSYKTDSDLKVGFFPLNSPHNAYLIVEHLAVPIKDFLRKTSLSRNLEEQPLQLQTRDRTTPKTFSLPSYNPPQCCTPLLDSDSQGTNSFSSPCHEASDIVVSESHRDGVGRGLSLDFVPALKFGQKGSEKRIEEASSCEG